MIREANPADRESVQRLYQMLCPGQPVNVRCDRIEQIRRDSNNYLLVVEHGGTVTATAFLTVCLDPMFGVQPYAVVENLVVDESVRGQGVGSHLLEHIERMCLGLHCSKIMLLSSSKRTQAHRFFSALGYSGTVSKGFKKYLGGRTIHRGAERDA